MIEIAAVILALGALLFTLVVRSGDQVITTRDELESMLDAGSADIVR